MNTLRLFSRQTKAVALVAMLIAATIIPALAMAATVTQRSISLSSSSTSATNVTYGVEFTSVLNAAAFVIDFCSNSPLIGQACDTPTGFSASAAATSTANMTVDDIDANTVSVVRTVSTPGTINVDIDGITNPSTAGPLYARITTYVTSAAMGTEYQSATDPGEYEDNGSIAMGITSSVAVSGAVLESMTFCLSKNTIAENCGGTLAAPVLRLGESAGGVIALTPGAVSSDSVYTQLSTNAVSGAVVRLKSNATDCGGLKRAGAPTACDIAPALATNITAGQAKFGVKTNTPFATDGVTNATGTLRPVPASNYNTTTYALNFVSGNATGVTSVFGDAIIDSNNAPVNNQNMQLTFGASISNNTPAGLYSADLSMIATGKF